MIDMHCHIIPYIDDGAKSVKDAIEMARIAEKDGIKKIINTSHFHPQFDYESGEKLKSELDKFNNLIKEKGIDVEVLIGNELYYDGSFLQAIDEKQFFSLNNSRYILVEFSPMNFPKNLKDVIYELNIRGYVPILAHVERYGEIQSDTSLIIDAIKEGALIQINASSILGKCSCEAGKITQLLLENNLVHFVGSDAHGPRHRRPMLKEAYDYVANHYGEQIAEIVFIKNPNKVINNKEIQAKINITSEEKKGTFFKRLFKKNR